MPIYPLYITHLSIYMLLNRGATQEHTNSDDDLNQLMSRFVVDGNGKRIGESIGITEDILIIKAGARFLGVPIKHIEEQEKTLLVKGLVDLKKAYELGKKWQDESTREFPNGENNEQVH